MPRLSKGLKIGKSFIISTFTHSSLWGEKYKAIHVPTNRLVEIHLLNKLIEEFPDAVAAMIDKANEQKGVIHKNIVESFGGGYLDPEKKSAYIASLYMENDESLSDLISKKYPLGAPLSNTRLIAYHLSNLLSDIKDTFIHGAITPSSVIISAVGRIYVKDFGIILSAVGKIPLDKLVEPEDLHFISPELKNGVETDISSDIFSVGTVVYFLLTGKPPTEDLQLKSNTPPDLRTALLKACSVDRAVRYSSPEELSEDLSNALKERKKRSSVIMVDLLESFQEDDEEDKKFMVQKGRLDYGPYSAREIREKAIDELILPTHIIVNIDSGFRKKLDKHPDFQDFMEEFLRRMELKRREAAEAHVAVKEKRQSRTFKLAIVLGIAGILAIATTIMLYKTVVDSGKGRRRRNIGGDDEFEVSLKDGSKTSKKRRRKRRRRRRRGHRRRSHSKSSGGNGSGGSSGDEIKVYALDNVQLTRTQINSVVNPAIRKVAASCIPSSGRVYIGYQISGRRGRITYASAKLNGKRNKKIARCAYRILKHLHFPKMNTDISGFGGISF